MIERREYLRLALEAFHPLGILREILQNHFDRDVTLQFAVARTVDPTHASSANGSNDLVATKLRTFSKRHRAKLYVRSQFAVQLILSTLSTLTLAQFSTTTSLNVDTLLL